VTVVGVMGEEFWYPMPPDIKMGQGETAPDLLVPWARFSERERPGQGRVYGVAARLQPGATVAQAQREATELALRYGEPNRDGGRDTARVRLLQEELALDARSTLLVLFGLIGCLLFVCCVNIGNLLVSRSQSRIRELAVRATLGATRTRLFRQLLTEYCVLATASGLLGLFLSAAVLNTLVGLLPAGLLLVPAIHVDLRMLGIAGIITAVTALLSGLAPALLATRADVSSALKAGGQSVARAPRWRRFASTMLVVETSVLLVVLTGGALLVNTILRLKTIDLGFAPDRLWTADFVAPRSLYPQRAQVGPLAGRMADALRGIPGVASVGASDWGLLRGVLDGLPMTIDGRPDTMRPEVRHVSADYFQTVDMSVRSGRLWTASDEEIAPRVAVINATAARRYWPGEDPIGRRITLNLGRAWPLEIVGVVSDLRETNERRAPAPSVYVPMNSSSCLFYNFRTLVIRTSQPRAGVGRDAVKAMAAVDSRLPVTVTRADEALANGRRGPRFYAVFVGLAGAFGLLLVAVGIAGVTAHGVTRRMREIGVRLALGANPAAVVGMVVRQVVAPVLVGLGVGGAAGLGVSRVLTSFLYEITPQDPVTHIIASSVLLAVALLASWLPARRAARVRPVDALRAE
jgi:putative ABC transport system permease protein